MPSPPIDWSLTLSAGDNLPHSNVVISGFLYLGFMTSPAKLVKINLSTHAEDSTLTFPNDFLHANLIQMVNVPSTGKIYGIFGVSTGIIIDEIDPAAMTTTNIVSVFGTEMTNCSMGTDQKFLYAGQGQTAAQPTGVFRFNLDGSNESDITIDFGAAKWIHAMQYDRATNKMFLTANSAAQLSSISRINVDSYTVEDTVEFVDSGNATDDFCFAKNFVYVGLEGTSGKVLKIQKNNFANITVLSTGVSAACFGTFFTGRYVWAIFNNGNIVRIKPTTDEMLTYDFGDAIARSEMPFDADRLYFTTYDSPSTIQACLRSALERRWILK